MTLLRKSLSDTSEDMSLGFDRNGGNCLFSLESVWLGGIVTLTLFDDGFLLLFYLFLLLPLLLPVNELSALRDGISTT